MGSFALIGPFGACLCGMFLVLSLHPSARGGLFCEPALDVTLGVAGASAVAKDVIGGESAMASESAAFASCGCGSRIAWVEAAAIAMLRHLVLGVGGHGVVDLDVVRGEPVVKFAGG
jgi:hypothetical protein